jgi:hypothetical protein
VNFARGAEPVQDRHSDVQDDEVRAQLERPGESFLPIRGFSANLNAAGFQDSPYPRPERFMIVDD